VNIVCLLREVMIWLDNRYVWIAVMFTMLVGKASVCALDYESDILPILKEHCFDCHSEQKDKVKGNLALDDLPDMRDYQRAKFSLIRPGNAKESQFLNVMKLGEGDDDFMPRKGSALPEKEIALIEKWITEGAMFKSEAGKAGMDGKAKGGAVSREMVDWKNSEGKVIKARFVRLTGESVMLLLENGKSYNYPLAKLSEESQAQAKKLAAGK